MLEVYDRLTYFSEDQWSEALRYVFPPEFQQLDDEQLEALFQRVLASQTPTEQQLMLESFGKFVRNVGKFAKKNAGVIGTVGGAVGGAIIGGPVGAAAGAKFGGSLGSKLQSKGNDKPRRKASRPTTQRLAPAAQRNPTPVRPELKTLLVANDPNYLLAIIQVVVRKVLKELLSKKNIKLEAVPLSPQASVIEAFANALAVSGEEQAIVFGAESPPEEQSEASLSPKERADQLLENLYA